MPSEHALMNDRRNHLENAQDHIHSISRIAQKYHDSGVAEITRQDIISLFDLVGDCTGTLQRYINARNWMSQCAMIAEVDRQLQDVNNRFLTASFDRERIWLLRFGGMAVSQYDAFVATLASSHLPITSTSSIYQETTHFRQGFGQYSRNIDSIFVTDNFEHFLRETFKIAIGNGLVCEDGLQFYPNHQGSARSIWLGSQLFLSGIRTIRI